MEGLNVWLVAEIGAKGVVGNEAFVEMGGSVGKGDGGRAVEGGHFGCSARWGVGMAAADGGFPERSYLCVRIKQYSTAIRDLRVSA